MVQTVETFQKGGVPAFVETLDAVEVGEKAGMPIAPVMIYGDDVSHVVTEEGIAYLYKTEGIEERRRALAAVAGVSPIGLRAKPRETAELRQRGIVAFPGRHRSATSPGQAFAARSAEHGGSGRLVWRLVSTAREIQELVMRQAILMTQIAESAALEHQYLASLARQSLVAEAQLTPKPGLVDGRGSGSHTDLSLEIIIRSAAAIEPFFRLMAAASASARVDAELRAVLAAIGREAESAMFKATGGTNSHKGAIWILGLLIAGASSSQVTAPARVAEVAGSHCPDSRSGASATCLAWRPGASSLRSSWRSRRGLRGFSSRDRLWIARSEFGAKPRSVRRNELAHGPCCRSWLSWRTPAFFIAGGRKG